MSVDTQLTYNSNNLGVLPVKENQENPMPLADFFKIFDNKDCTPKEDISLSTAIKEKNKIAKMSVKEDLTAISGKFQKLYGELKALKERSDSIPRTEVLALQAELKLFQKKMAKEREGLAKMEPSVIAILNRLGPERCDPEMNKGTQRGQLRKEIIGLWSSLGFYRHELSLETQNITQRIQHLPELKELHSKIETLNKEIDEFKSSEENIELKEEWGSSIFGPSKYVRTAKKEDFLELTARSRETLKTLHTEALLCKQELQNQIEKLPSAEKKQENLTTQLERALKLAFDNKDQIEANVKKFKEVHDAALLKESSLVRKMESLWEKISKSMDQLQTNVIRLEITSKTESLCFPFERTAKGQLDKNLMLNPNLYEGEI